MLQHEKDELPTSTPTLTSNRCKKFHLTYLNLKCNQEINHLINLCMYDTVSPDEIAIINNMISKKKKKLVLDIYKRKHPRSSRFYTCSDGRLKSRNPDFYATDEDKLLEKLYEFYFCQTMETEFRNYISRRLELKNVSKKTFEEDISYWNRIISPDPISSVPMNEIQPKHIINLFKKWTGNGFITRKEFCNRKAVLNGIFDQALYDEIIVSNPISSIRTNSFRFKPVRPKKKAYSAEERKLLLNYIENLPKQDAYTLAIRLALHGTFRVGEIKAMRINNTDESYIHINKQIVDEHEIIQDKSGEYRKGANIKSEKDPKGNAYYSVRINVLTPEMKRIIQEAVALNPDGTYLFMYRGSTISTDTLNRRLKKYSNECGLPYLSSHGLRFTNASLLFQEGNLPLVDLSQLLGHSNTGMTLHYAEQKIKPINTQIVSDTLG